MFDSGGGGSGGGRNRTPPGQRAPGRPFRGRWQRDLPEGGGSVRFSPSDAWRSLRSARRWLVQVVAPRRAAQGPNAGPENRGRRLGPGDRALGGSLRQGGRRRGDGRHGSGAHEAQDARGQAGRTRGGRERSPPGARRIAHYQGRRRTVARRSFIYRPGDGWATRRCRARSPAMLGTCHVMVRGQPGERAVQSPAGAPRCGGRRPRRSSGSPDWLDCQHSRPDQHARPRMNLADPEGLARSIMEVGGGIEVRRRQQRATASDRST